MIGSAPSVGSEQLRVRGAGEHAHHAHLRLLADELGRTVDDDVEPVHLADGRAAVVAVDLDELQLQLGVLGDRGLRGEGVALAFLEHLEVVEVDVAVPLGGGEEEALARRRLDLRQPRAAVADEEGKRARVELDAERLRPGAGREHPQPALDVHRERPLRDDDPVALAGGALARQDLARPVGDVLPRHLDEAERRDLDDVGLRPVALQLRAQRLLDRLPVLRVRHVDEVDDDDAADVAQPELAHDLLHRFEVVLDDRVLEPRVRLFEREPTKRPVLTSMTVNASA